MLKFDLGRCCGLVVGKVDSRFKDLGSSYGYIIVLLEISQLADKLISLKNLLTKFERKKYFLPCLVDRYWQTLTVRSTMYGDTMAVLQFSPQKMTKVLYVMHMYWAYWDILETLRMYYILWVTACRCYLFIVDCWYRKKDCLVD